MSPLTLLVNLALGLVFGIGLIVSGMADPAKVLAFLDPLGGWDPSLAFVMAGAVLVTFVGYRATFRHGRPILSDSFDLPARRDIDRPLLIGAALFGIGWGLGGFCPGPAVVSLGLGSPGALTFVPAMLLGMWAARRIGSAVPSPPKAQPSAP